MSPPRNVENWTKFSKAPQIIRHYKWKDSHTKRTYKDLNNYHMS